VIGFIKVTVKKGVRMLFTGKIKTVAGICDNFTAALEVVKESQQKAADELEIKLVKVQIKLDNAKMEATAADRAILNIQKLFGYVGDTDD
jgi:hypothetical protein